MPKHIRERATHQPVKSARPVRVCRHWAADALRRLPDTLTSRCAPRLSDCRSGEQTALFQSDRMSL